MQRHHDAVIELPFLGIGDVDLIHDIGNQTSRQVRRPGNLRAFYTKPRLVLYRPGIGLSHTDTERRHVVHEEIGKMLGTDYDQRFGAGFLNRPAHPVETFIQPVAQDGIGAVGTPRDTRRMAAGTCKNEWHRYSPTIA